MKMRVPSLRLLPATIAMLAVVLAMKSVLLVRSAITDSPAAALITGAWASAHDEKAPGENTDAKAAPPRPASTDPKKPGGEPPKVEGPPPATDSEKAVLLDLRERRQQLEARESTLSSRESVLAAAEQKLSSRVEELQGLQKKLESLDASHRQQEDVAWQGLVKVYETMKPRDAAVIFNDLSLPVLLSVVDRMKEAKAAAVLAAMSPDRAREVTTQLAQTRTKGAAALETGDKPPSPGGLPGGIPLMPGKAAGT
jgi:flagellar motility protein MotE (MotC chaperone)